VINVVSCHFFLSLLLVLILSCQHPYKGLGIVNAQNAGDEMKDIHFSGVR